MSNVPIFQLVSCISSLSLCTPDPTSCHVAYFLPTRYSSVHILRHVFTLLTARISVSSPEHSLHSSVNTHISVSLLEVDGGRGAHVLGLRLEFKLSALN